MATLKEEIAKMQEQLLPQIPKEALGKLLAATDRLVQSGALAKSLGVGDHAPSFTLSNAQGHETSSDELLKEGPLVINFYRGAWCPYCNLELNALQHSLPEFQAAGAELVAISPNLPDHSLSSIEKHDLKFEVLSDIGNTVAKKFGLVFNLAEEIRPIYTQFGFGLPEFNGDQSWELPAPATYVIDSDGTIVYANVNGDYTQRAEPAEIVRAVQMIGKSVQTA